MPFMPRLSFCLIASASILFAFGLLMIFNTSAAQIIDRSTSADTHAVFFKQFCYGIAGFWLGLGVYALGYETVLRYSPFVLALGIFLLICVFLPGVGQTVNGARRWICFLGVSFQPSECMKILAPAAYIYWALRQKEISLLAFLKILGWLAVPLVLILLEPDNGTTVIVFAVLFILLILTRAPIRYWAVPLIIMIAAGSAAAYRMPHVPDRIRIYLHPELDLRGKGHQPHQAKIAAGSGGLFGRGLGESLQKLNYLPEARNDYIAAIFAEEAGFAGMLGLIVLYMMFCSAGFLIAIRSRERGGFLFAASLTFLIAIQAFLNLGVVSGLLPSKGMTLPFFSQGGTSLIVNCVALFLLLDIARKPKAEAFHES